MNVKALGVATAIAFAAAGAANATVTQVDL